MGYGKENQNLQLTVNDRHIYAFSAAFRVTFRISTVEISEESFIHTLDKGLMSSKRIMEAEILDEFSQDFVFSN